MTINTAEQGQRTPFLPDDQRLGAGLDQALDRWAREFPGRIVAMVPTTYRHGGEGCGQRVPSPHVRCQATLLPYLAAERLHLRWATVLVCLACQSAWREATG